MGRKSVKKNHTPSYVYHSVRNYQERNRRLSVRVKEEYYQEYVERYGRSISFNGYVKSLMDNALENELFGTLLVRSNESGYVLKECIFPKDYEIKLKEKYDGRTAEAFSLTTYVQWLIANDLGH